MAQTDLPFRPRWSRPESWGQPILRTPLRAGSENEGSNVSRRHCAGRLMAIIKIGGPTEPEIDRHEHQSCAMCDWTRAPTASAVSAPAPSDGAG
jgi:hypothetical protein